MDLCEFEDSLVYKESPRIARADIRETLSGVGLGVEIKHWIVGCLGHEDSGVSNHRQGRDHCFIT